MPDNISGGMYRPPVRPVSDSLKNQNSKQNKKKISPIFFFLAIVLCVIGFVVWKVYRAMEERKMGEQIEVISDPKEVIKEYPTANVEDVSPISGIACDNWNKRAFAVMQPSDVSARPLAGFSQADMVIEMPVLPSGKPRLMGVYICEGPEEVGSLRSARHDFLHLAKGLDAILVHWGGSQFAKEKLNEGLVENVNCNNDGGKSAAQYCFRKEGFAKGVDSGYAKFSKILEGAKKFGYRAENEFSGYAHQGEAPVADRIDNGLLKVGLDSSSGDFYVEYEYDKETNSYLRLWAKKEDVDRNNGKRIAPKNVVVLIASQEIMMDDNNSVYNNVQLGDPWYDESDSGEAFYYFNGQEKRGKWKKDKTRMDSKMLFLDQNGNEIKFVPGQIWVEVLEPGRALKWITDESL
ncbi:DUF3048 domain-containing protein [bacterium]|jgi:hypothetical protein|nr:DUF3048 domain-containing protein [bacterium]MBT4251220.1 DUF3048 domain-containing protein [bacterium]MBT4597988.1 DUF3048 domain-containing protein [bacterium]MBT6753599.1 DUF3048 domain-containing protein [bacterium]MBT7037714.1 DUF3048 domain-containing protein [bacterium]